MKEHGSYTMYFSHIISEEYNKRKITKLLNETYNSLKSYFIKYELYLKYNYEGQDYIIDSKSDNLEELVTDFIRQHYNLILFFGYLFIIIGDDAKKSFLSTFGEKYEHNVINFISSINSNQVVGGGYAKEISSIKDYIDRNYNLDFVYNEGSPYFKVGKEIEIIYSDFISKLR
jgi:hypothetical protein